ncbi:Hypothetical predicted protein [Olea europaea subsp. europaea]|uniref:Uncharacterized protein n=1 Tax=Olea europaea subsp. europaea TaxID=158383 RepID=A0A8S0UTW2_OLEEU|nr:Hypothetical predicted protein [Olea europaea subsp. europaea]
MSEFEFECVTPKTPDSPADHLFLNGRLLPHVFQLQSANSFNYSRSTSSVISKDSLMSSRSNSTNSRISNSSSARTSTSEASERKVMNGPKIPSKLPANTAAVALPYCSSRGWQFIAPAPVLMHQGSRSRPRKAADAVEPRESKSRKQGKNGSDLRGWFGRRVLRSFVSSCKECHAIRTPTREGVWPRNALQEHK